MNKQIELRNWIVTLNGKEVGRYRYRGEAETHAQNLRKSMPSARVEATFDHHRVSLR